MTPTIRRITPRDYQNAAFIDRECFARPWSSDAIYRTLCPGVRDRVGILAVTGTFAGGHPVGYAIYDRQDATLKLMRLGVRPGQFVRGQGTGRALLNRVMHDLSPWGATSIVATVHGGNLTAHLFLRACGFVGEVAGGDYYRFVFDLGVSPLVVVKQYIENQKRV